MWEEGGRYPDLILELLSPASLNADYGRKMQLYQDVFKTPEYFLYSPDTQTFDGSRHSLPLGSCSRLFSNKKTERL